MLEGLVTWVLNNYVGEYLENLNADQISVALLQGQVELENVPLKKSALRKFDIPVQVKSGVIGKLTLSVPITHIRSEPWVLKMSDLLVLLGPSSPGYDVEGVEQYEQTKKQQMLDELEQAHVKQLLVRAGITPKEDPSQNQWWGASLVSTVVNNIQLILTNVHIRYEDEKTMPDGTPFNFGIRVQNITVQTTNAQWKPGFVRPADGANVFKKLDIKGLSVFWNCKQEVHEDVTTPDALKKTMSPEVMKNCTFILQPFSMQARMEKNGSKFPLKMQPPVPRFKFDLRPEKIEIELSKRQLAQIRILGREWARFDRARAHRKWRPLVPVNGNSKQWWLFAYHRIVEENRRQRSAHSPEYLTQRARLLNSYCRAYARKLEAHLTDHSKASKEKESASHPTSPTTPPASAVNQEDVAFMRQIEHDSQFTYQELNLFRETIFRRIVKSFEEKNPPSAEDSADTFEVVAPESEPPTRTQESPSTPTADGPRHPTPTPGQSGGLYGWITSWFSAEQEHEANPSDEASDGPFADFWTKAEERKLPPNLRKVEKRIEEEILEVLSETWDDSTVLRRDNLLAGIILRLERMIVRFVDVEETTPERNSSRVLALDMRQVASRIQLSPREHRTEITLSVGDMSVQRLHISSAQSDLHSSMSDIASLHSTQEEDDSLLYGFAGALDVDTQLLFAVGRAKEEKPRNDVIDAIRDKLDTSVEEKLHAMEEKVAEVEAKRAAEEKEPIVKLFYRRLAPRLNIFHELDVRTAPISVMYDEDALAGLGDLFSTDTALKEMADPAAAKLEEDIRQIEETNTQFFFTMSVPDATFELRSRQTSLLSDRPRSPNGAPFAAVKLVGASLAVVRSEQYVTKLKLGLSSLVVEDLYEKAGSCLLRTVFQSDRVAPLKSLSRSCPDLAELNPSMDFATSLPAHVRFKPTYIQSASGSGSTHKLSSAARKPVAEDNDFGHSDGNQAFLNVTFVDPAHARFDSEYNKERCTFEVEFEDVEVTMNRRSWTMLLDFFGLLVDKDTGSTLPRFSDSLAAEDPALVALLYGSSAPAMEPTSHGAGARASICQLPYNFRCAVGFNTIKVFMNYPANGTHLGAVSLRTMDLELKMNLSDAEEPMTIGVTASELRLTDGTPFYNRLYDERLSLKSAVEANGNTGKLRIDILKYRTDDPTLQRDCDIRVAVRMDPSFHACYVHTHRYLCAFLDFWTQFAELHDHVRKRAERAASEATDLTKTRCKLAVKLDGGCSLIFPLNQFSDEAIVVETSQIGLHNKFRLTSQTPQLSESSIENACGEDDYNCLLDIIRVECAEISVHEARRIPNDQSPKKARSTSSLRMDGFQVGQGFFRRFYFAALPKNVLNRLFDLKVDVYRNLSALVSHNVPDMAIVTQFEDVDVRFTTSFYCLLRGFLEQNLGDHIIPVPETIPIEVLQNPSSVSETSVAEKYPTFSFRMFFKNVKFHFLTPMPEDHAQHADFGRMVLHSGRISFDAYIDDQSELDLICESTELVDSRYDQMPKTRSAEAMPGREKPNAFPTIVTARQTQPAAKAAVGERPSGSSAKLMLEAHIMLKKEEPPTVTLVLMNAQVLLIIDWLNGAKDFILQNTSFSAPEEKAPEKWLYAEPKEGVLVRSLSGDRTVNVGQPAHTITLKITLKECDLILLEKPQRDSLALVAFTTAVLNLSDNYDMFDVNLEIQRLGFSWCVMTSERASRCQISNDFSVTISVLREACNLGLAEQARSLLSGFGDLARRQTLSIECNEAVARCSYKDLLVAQSVVNGALKHLTDALALPSVVPQPVAGNPNSKPPNKSPFCVTKTVVKADHLCAWLLDDSQGVALPLLRVVFSDLSLERSPDNLQSVCTFNVDYFNQRVFGWEPLIEPWKVARFTMQRHKSHVNFDLQPDRLSTLDIILTQTFIQQAKHFSSKWSTVKRSLDHDLRKMCTRSRSDHLPYLLRNETGTNMWFTTAAEEIIKAREGHRKPTAKWFATGIGKSTTFEFPTKLLLARENTGDSRRLVVRVEGWDEISPVSVDSVGTYFRVARMSNAPTKPIATGANLCARVVVEVTMDPDGRKVVTVRSALVAINRLPDPVVLKLDNSNITWKHDRIELRLEAGETMPLPLKYVNSEMEAQPATKWKAVGFQRVEWRTAKVAGDIADQLLCFVTATPNAYWVCASSKRENYPEQDPLSGHTISFIPPLTLLNLLPVDAEFICGGYKCPVQAGQREQIVAVNLDEELRFTVSADRFQTIRPSTILRSSLALRSGGGESKRLHLRMHDPAGRPLDVYGSVNIVRGGAIHISLWVPYWIVNRCGIPLVIKQEAADDEGAGQFAEHERAKDRNPLMFSFADEGCPQQCVVRVGRDFAPEPGYRPQYSRRFSLSPGVQALKLLVTHDDLSTLIYNVGVELRQGTGRYKDTQVVIFTPRYHLNNQSSVQLFRPSKHVRIASKCNLIWHENFEDKRMLCIRREDVPHWSCPFRIDHIGSFHITMRDRDETPRFVRAEIILSSAFFSVTFTDASFFPAPIKIENLSPVPVLYQQASGRCREHHLRTICRASSVADYAWDDLYASKLLTLQVYENKSHTYDPSKPTQGPPLVYTNHVFIQYLPSFDGHTNPTQRSEDGDLVMSVLKEGKVMLTQLNVTDSSQSQLWHLAEDNCLENVGLNHRAKPTERYVLDVLEKAGGALMMQKRNSARNATQNWQFTMDGRLKCGLPDRYVEARGNTLYLSAPLARPSTEDAPLNQLFRKQRQKPGSGVLDVQCLHVGPTLVVRITDRADRDRELSLTAGRITERSRRATSPRTSTAQADELSGFEASMVLPSGIGISLVNNAHEELIYARLQGVQIHMEKKQKTYQLNGHVNQIQVDNQLLTTERWQVLYCEVNALKGDADSIDSHADALSAITMQPALKLEMNCTPMENYDAFDCFRIKLCDMCVLLDETLLWKFVQFIQETGTADSVQPKTLLQPPNIEPESVSMSTPTRRCYFGTLDLEVGNVSLSVATVPKNSLSRELRRLKEQFNIKLVSFENALVTLPPFRQFHYFETLKFLVETLSQFYMAELQKQTLNIVVTMDAFGNPLGLVTDLRESFQGLLFEGDVGGFVSGLGYGVTNSISKVASSMAHGVGSLTFDEQHEVMRRKMLRSQSQQENTTALSHLYGGLKGLGVGVFGGLTAIAKNTIAATREDGAAGVVRGITTGAVDTVTKPVQGMLDLVEGAASALKDVVGGPLVRKSHFPETRVRLPRVGTNLQSLLPCYARELADAQQELLRISGYVTNEILLDVVVFLTADVKGQRSVHRALICTEQCYVLKQVDDHSSTVVHRIPYKYLKNVQPSSTGLNSVEFTYEQNSSAARRAAHNHLWCNSREIAIRLSDKVLRAKQLYDHAKRTLSVVEDYEQSAGY